MPGTRTWMVGLAVCAGLAGGCGDDSGEGSGAVSIVLDAEDTITDGIEPGDRVEDIADGWHVTFDRYLAAVGHVHVHLATDEEVEREIDEAYVVDLTTVSESGLVRPRSGASSTRRPARERTA